MSSVSQSDCQKLTAVSKLATFHRIHVAPELRTSNLGYLGLQVAMSMPLHMSGPCAFVQADCAGLTYLHSNFQTNIEDGTRTYTVAVYNQGHSWQCDSVLKGVLSAKEIVLQSSHSL